MIIFRQFERFSPEAERKEENFIENKKNVIKNGSRPDSYRDFFISLHYTKNTRTDVFTKF
ncbi:hypothetical protein RCH33_1525 [Flavobacterium daejeonense]|nr:hypothetical protein RCH33_1525 [Flavobacterium daejeonense]